jgi:hypothetical protein
MIEVGRESHGSVEIIGVRGGEGDGKANKSFRIGN